MTAKKLSFPRRIEAVCPTMRCVAHCSSTNAVQVTFLDGQEMTLKVPERVHRLYFSTDGRFLSVNRRYVWHLDSEEQVTLPPSASSLVWLSGDRVALAMADGMVRVCDLETGRVELSLESLAPTRLAASEDGRYMACIHDRLLVIYQTEPWELFDSSEVPGPSLMRAAFHPEGLVLQQVASSVQRVGELLLPQGRPSTLTLWRGQPLARLDCERVFDFAGELMAQGNSQGEVKLYAFDWERFQLKEERESLEASGPVDQLAFHNEGRFLSASTQNGADLWQL